MKIYLKKVDGITIPEKGSQVSAGYDIIATSDPKTVGDFISIPIPGGEQKLWRRVDYIEYETNLFIAPSEVQYHTLIHPRSSISKYNLVLANSIGLVDNDYRGMVICRFKYIWQPEDYRPKMGEETDAFPFSLFGWLNEDKIYKRGDKISQLVVEPTIQVEWELVDDLSNTSRGEGGFGSTDAPKLQKDEIISIKKSATFQPIGEGIVPSIIPQLASGVSPKREEEIKKYEEAHKGKTILEQYQKAGGLPTRKKYSDEIKEREQV